MTNPFHVGGHAAFCSGGAIANLVVVGIFQILFGVDLNFLRPGSDLDLVTPLVLANAFTAFINLTPYYTSVSGRRLPTDGLILLTLPFRAIPMRRED